VEVNINWLAVIAAALTGMLVGAVWYSKTGFLKTWLQLTKLDEKKLKQSGAGKEIAVSFVLALLTAYVLAHVTFLANAFFHNSFLFDALTTSLWLWLGLIAARFITHDLFERRPGKLTLLTISFELVTLLAMGLIIGIMQP